MKKVAFIGLTLFFFIAQPAFAHRDGCHRWHSCPSDTGSYVCGDLGYYSECPGGAPQQPAQQIQEVAPTNTPLPTRIYPTWTPYPTRKPIPTRTPTPSLTPTPTITPTAAPTATPSPTLSPTPKKEVHAAVTQSPKAQPTFWSWVFGFFGR